MASTCSIYSLFIVYFQCQTKTQALLILVSLLSLPQDQRSVTLQVILASLLLVAKTSDISNHHPNKLPPPSPTPKNSITYPPASNTIQPSHSYLPHQKKKPPRAHLQQHPRNTQFLYNFCIDSSQFLLSVTHTAKHVCTQTGIR